MALGAHPSRLNHEVGRATEVNIAALKETSQERSFVLYSTSLNGRNKTLMRLCVYNLLS